MRPCERERSPSRPSSYVTPLRARASPSPRRKTRQRRRALLPPRVAPPSAQSLPFPRALPLLWKTRRSPPRHPRGQGSGAPLVQTLLRELAPAPPSRRSPPHRRPTLPRAPRHRRRPLARSSATHGTTRRSCSTITTARVASGAAMWMMTSGTKCAGGTASSLGGWYEGRTGRRLVVEQHRRLRRRHAGFAPPPRRRARRARPQQHCEQPEVRLVMTRARLLLATLPS